MEHEASLTAIELMRQILPRSQFFREYAPEDAGDAADEALAEAQAEAARAAQADAISAYLGRVEGEDITEAVHLLATALASKAVICLMQSLYHKTGRMPSAQEMTAELDQWEMSNLEPEL
jgi:hypothetical protein